MKCPKCPTELILDHTKTEGDKTVYVYVCLNPKCEIYRKAFTVSGQEELTQIKERPVNQ